MSLYECPEKMKKRKCEKSESQTNAKKLKNQANFTQTIVYLGIAEGRNSSSERKLNFLLLRDFLLISR